MKVRILSDRCRLGHTGDVIDLDDHPGVHGRALVRGGFVEIVPDKPRKKKAAKKKAAD